MELLLLLLYSIRPNTVPVAPPAALLTSTRCTPAQGDFYIMSVCLLFDVPATSKVISGWVQCALMVTL